MRTVAIHQPNYLPWSGYFYKMLLVDDFIFDDEVVMSKPSFTSRTKIKTREDVAWLTVPCSRVVGKTLIKEVLVTENRWKKKHVGTLVESYRKAPYYELYMPRLKKLICSDVICLADLNLRLIKQFIEWLDISCSFHVSSELGVSGAATDAIVDLVSRVGGTTYLSGPSGRKYLKTEKFSRQKIHLTYYDFRPPVYPQLWGQFEPGLSVVDLLFNCGPDSKQILRNCGNMERRDSRHGWSYTY